MKKYYPVDFDDKGNAVLGTPKNTPTSNGFIPTTWAPGGGDAGTGIRMVSITPAFQMDPAMETVCPIYWNGETQQIEISAFGMGSGDYTVTITPTADAYAYADEGEEGIISDTKGAPITFEKESAALQRGYPLCVLDGQTDIETLKIVAVLKFTPNE